MHIVINDKFVDTPPLLSIQKDTFFSSLTRNINKLSDDEEKQKRKEKKKHEAVNKNLVN